MTSNTHTKEEVKRVVDQTLELALAQLMQVNKTIHSNPELAWEEVIAHEALTSFLSSHNEEYKVTPSAYGIKTAFEARNSPNPAKGRTVNFNAEYDALPEIGHACGHNLIAISSLAAFVALSSAVKHFKVAGNVQLLGTPAEESGGGKIVLLDAGAFEGVDVSLMGHPAPCPTPGGLGYDEGITGIAGQRSIAHLGLFATFHGKNAHAGINPWDGVNALDALVCAYNNISVLRQQMRPEERVHGSILEAPKVANVIPDFTKVGYSVRGPTIDSTRVLGDKVIACFRAAGLATGCEVELSEESMYADLRINNTLCDRFTANIAEYGQTFLPTVDIPFAGSTDQGNVTYAVPSLHLGFGIPAGNTSPHERGFAAHAGTEEAFETAVRIGKALALTGWDVLTNDGIFESIKKDFEKDKKTR